MRFTDYMKTVDIDVNAEIRSRGQELGKIGKDVPTQYLDVDECRERVFNLVPRIAANLGVDYDREQIRKRTKVYSIRPKDIFTESIGKEDIIYIPMWLTAMGAIVPRLLPDYYMATIVGAGITATTLNAFLYSRVVAHTNPLTGDIKIPVSPFCKNKYDFDSEVSHELTHGLLDPQGFTNRMIKGLIKRKRRKNEGIAQASASLMMDILYDETGNVNYRRTKLKKELDLFIDARKFGSGLRRYATAVFPFSGLANRDYYEGFAKVLELQRKYGSGVLPRIARGEFDKEF